jgi:hypothetical protein
MQRREEQFEIPEPPLGFGLRQPSGAFDSCPVFESGRGLPQSKTLRVHQHATEMSTPPRLCNAISQFRRVQRRFFRSADSLVREFLPQHWQLADKAVRAPLVAAPPRCAFALKIQN